MDSAFSMLSRTVQYFLQLRCRTHFIVIFLQRGTFLDASFKSPLLIFRYSFHPCVTAVARKRPRSFCQSAGGRLQLNTHTPYLCGFAQSGTVNWYMYGVHRTCAETTAAFVTSHVTTNQRRKYHFDDCSDRAVKGYMRSFRITSEKSAVSLLESRELRYI